MKRICMTRMIFILTLLQITFTSYAAVGQSKVNWRTYRDTVNIGFIMTFKYPDNLVAESIENARCVGEKINTDFDSADSDVTNTMRWCIWMQDIKDNPIESYIATEKSIFKGKVTEKSDTINIANSKAVRVTLVSTDDKDPYRQLIYLKKYSTLFEIVNSAHETEKDFEIFYNSLTLDEVK
jgi:hypothetical protein